MRNENQFSNLQPKSENTQREAPQTEGRIAQMSESLEHIQSDIRRTRLQVERHMDEYESHVRRTRALWVIAVVLVASLVGMSWFGYPYVNEHRTLFGQLPALQNMFQGLGDRMNSVEGKLNAWAGEGTSLTNRIAKLEQSVSSNFRSARIQAQSFATQTGQRIRDEMNQSLQAIQNRIAGVESTHRESAEHLAQLENDLAELRQEMANMREQTLQQAGQTQQLHQTQQLTADELSDLKGQLDVNTSKLDDVANQVNFQRIEFEISKNRTERVAPGVYLTIQRTDVGQQRVDGWLELASEGRRLRIREQGAQRPLTFVTEQQKERAHQLVLTRIEKDAIAGYLLVPAPMANASVRKE